MLPWLFLLLGGGGADCCAATAAAAAAMMMMEPAAAAAAAPAQTLASTARDRVQAVVDPQRAAVLLRALDNQTTPVQALAVNRLLGVCGVPEWPSGYGEMGAARGMCRVAEQRPWDFPFDHGLHCNMVDEWFFFVGAFHVNDTVLGVELMFSFSKLAPDPQCTCEYDTPTRNRTDSKPHRQLRTHDPSGRLAEVQFAVIVAPKTLGGSAVSPIAKHIQATPLVQWWRGENSSVWGFQIGEYSITAGSNSLTELHVVGNDSETGISVDLKLRRTLPPLLQGMGSGYVGDPKDSNGEAYYSLTGLSPHGLIVVGNQTYTLAGEQHGMGWLDHQYGSIGVASNPVVAALAWGRYAIANQNVQPASLRSTIH